MAGEQIGFRPGGHEAEQPMQAPLLGVLQEFELGPPSAPGVCTDGAGSGPRHSHTARVQHVDPLTSLSLQKACCGEGQEMLHPPQTALASTRHEVCA